MGWSSKYPSLYPEQPRCTNAREIWPHQIATITFAAWILAANMGPHTNTKLDRNSAIICLLRNLDYIHLQEICLNSKVFPVHDNTYNIEDWTQYSVFWHMVDITNRLFTSHRSCSLAMNPVKFHGSDCCHENSHHVHGRLSKRIGPPILTIPKVPRNIPTHTTHIS